jgi:delta14-sterol reductase
MTSAKLSAVLDASPQICAALGTDLAPIPAAPYAPLPITLETFAVALAVLTAFTALLFLGSRLLPGPERLGAPTPAGRKRYRLNGLPLFGLVLGVVAVAGLLRPPLLLFPYLYFWPLFVAGNLFAVLISGILFLQGRRTAARTGTPRPTSLAAALKDYYSGIETNPDWLGVDLKMFAYRPSFIALTLINVSFAFGQFQVHGAIAPQMWLFQIFMFVYVLNYFHFEYGMLYSWDITTEKFGGMLVWANFGYQPFFFSLPGWYLADNFEPFPPAQMAALTTLFVIGFWLLRGANEQKHRFKEALYAARARGELGTPPCLIWKRPAETLGGKILVSGFWGVGRKLNYTGELFLYYAWTLTVGTQSFVPYLIPIWLTLFFIHRAQRDEQKCRHQYGELWNEYRQRARFRMLPGIY